MRRAILFLAGLAALWSGGAWAQQAAGPYTDSRNVPDTPGSSTGSAP